MELLRRIARTLNVLLVLGLAAACSAGFQYAYAQTAGPTQPSAQPTAPANAAPSSQAAPADPHIDKSQIAQRLNRELDFNLETTTGGWQHALDRIDGELARPRLRYTELNRLRDDLQRIRSDVAEAWSKIQPRLDADRDQIKLLGPAPAAGAPPEPEQAARNRAEMNYHLGLLSAAEATVNSTNLRIDNLLDKIQDIRTEEFHFRIVSTDPRPLRLRNLGECARNMCRTLRAAFASWSPSGGPTHRIAATSPASRSRLC